MITGQTVVTLIVDGAIFPNMTMRENWFSGGHNQTFITGVHIYRSYLHIIEAKAFASRAWSSVRELKFIEIFALKCLSGWASGLTLSRLSFISTHLLDVEYDFLYGCSATIIQLTKSLNDAKIIDITGIGVRNEVQMVQIDGTTIMQHIDVMDFSAIRMVERLILLNCSIESIAVNAFVHLQRLVELDLRGNRLQTLPPTIFDSLLERRKLQSILFSANIWQCYCDLIRVRRTLSEYGIVFDGFPANCSTDGNLQAIDSSHNLNATRCKESLAPVPKTLCRSQPGFNFMYISYPKIRMHIDKAYETIHFHNHNNRKRMYSVRITQAMHESVQQLNNCRLQSIECRWYENTQPYTTVPVPRHTIDGNRDDPTDTATDDTIEMFCFLDAHTKTRIWPLNCFTYCRTCIDQQKDPIWLRIDSIYFAIAILLTVFIVILLFGMIFGYLLMRAKPQLLTGIERVVMLQSTNGRRRESVTVFIMPSSYVHPMEMEWFVFVCVCGMALVHFCYVLSCPHIDITPHSRNTNLSSMISIIYCSSSSMHTEHWYSHEEGRLATHKPSTGCRYEYQTYTSVMDNEYLECPGRTRRIQRESLG